MPRISRSRSQCLSSCQLTIVPYPHSNGFIPVFPPVTNTIVLLAVATLEPARINPGRDIVRRAEVYRAGYSNDSSAVQTRGHFGLRYAISTILTTATLSQGSGLQFCSANGHMSRGNSRVGQHQQVALWDYVMKSGYQLFGPDLKCFLLIMILLDVHVYLVATCSLSEDMLKYLQDTSISGRDLCIRLSSTSTG